MNAEEPLLTGAVDYENYEALNQDLTDGGKYEVSVKSEFRFITKSSIPLVATFFLQYLLSVTSIYAAGRLGPKELAAASLGVCTFNITGLAVYQGMATSLDSLCSQAYGSGRIQNVGLYFQRCSMMILAITVFPLSFIWWFSGSLLGFLIPDAELVAMTQTFLRISSFGAPGLLFFETGKRFLQAQHIFNAGTYVLLVIAPLNLTINWLLVWHPVYGLGFIGAPIAISIIFWLTSILMLCYVLYVDGKRCWGGLDITKACSNWSPMLKLAVPGVIMVEAEYLAFEVLTIFAASFGTEALAAQSIASNVGSLTFQLPFAIAVSISTRIGHHVGKQDVKAAKLVSRLSYVFGTVSAVTNFSIVFFGRHALGKMFTSSEDVLKVSNVILILSAINQLCDSYNVLGAGVLRGQGRQRIGSILNLISYYVIALPLGYTLSFYANYELKGLWFGLIAGVFFLAVGELVAIVFSNWKQIMIDSHGRHDH